MKKSEKKYIKLGKAYIENEVIKVVIEEQSHRGIEFGDCKVDEENRWASFKASNGLELCSAGHPAAGDNIIFMRGKEYSSDNGPLYFESLKTYNAFVEAVKEYNEYFSEPKVKEVTMADLEKLLGYPVKIKKG